MIKAKQQKGKIGDQSFYYYCDNLKECINRNSFINETRKKLKRKKFENLKVKNIVD
ncbi:MAG: hypothetical protein ACFFDL_16885 [Promethearchaeota archaeon]